MSAVDAAGSAQGRRLADRYRLTHVIGSGGSGTVWVAVDEVLGRKVAVKDVVVPPWLSEEERELLRERTLREAQAACRIDHPNVVKIYDVIEQDGRPWIIMQLVQAPSLAEIIEDSGPCTPSRAADIGLQVLGALQAAHAHGILHRDVKPSNVLVEGGWVVLADFGIATMPGEESLTAPDALVGAPSYIAPERVRGELATPASDLWALGATLYTAVEGRPPHLREGGALPILTAVATDEPDPPVRAGALAPLLEQMLRKDPTERPSAEDVERSLRRITLLAAGLTTETIRGTNALAGAQAEGAADGASPATGAAELGATQQVSRPDLAQKRDRPRAHVFAAAAVVTLLALLLGSLLAKEAAVPGVPASKLPSGVPATTVPVTSTPAAEPSRANPVPVRKPSPTPAQPAVGASPDSTPTVVPSGQPTGSPTPNPTQEPTQVTTTGTTAAQPAPTSDPAGEATGEATGQQTGGVAGDVTGDEVSALP